MTENSDRFGPNTAQVEALLARLEQATTDELVQLSDAVEALGDERTADRMDGGYAYREVRYAAWHAGRYATRAVAQHAAVRSSSCAGWDDVQAAAVDAAEALVVADLVGQHGLEQDHIDTLLKPVVEVFGPVESW